MEQKLVSVIIPVYKTDEISLRRAIESIINQSYKELEIVLIDDGSPDQCGAICDSYADIDKRIRVIHKINGGVSSARNCGLKEVSGDYIFFLDSDDVLKENGIEILLLVAQSTGAEITVCSCRHVKNSEIDDLDYGKTLKRLKTVEAAEALNNLIFNDHVFEGLEPTAVWGKLYKRTVISWLEFDENLTIGEDFVFNYFAIQNSRAVTYCNIKLYNYNFVETSLMNSQVPSPKLIRSFEELVKFEKSQRDREHSNNVVVRCVNIAFTLYLKIPSEQHDEINIIENYIRNNRKVVLDNKRASIKIKAACLISCIDFKLVRVLFNMVNSRLG